MASIDGGTLALQKELKCQINSVRAPDTQEFLYLAPWEGDKDRLCVSEQALTKQWGFFFYSSSHNFCLFFLLLLLSFEQRSGSMSVDVTPLAQHLPCTRQTFAPVWRTLHKYRCTHAYLPVTSQSRRKAFQKILIWVVVCVCFFFSWSVAAVLL